MIYPTYTEPGFNAAALALSRARREAVFCARQYRKTPSSRWVRLMLKTRLHMLHAEDVIRLHLYRPRACSSHIQLGRLL